MANPLRLLPYVTPSRGKIGRFGEFICLTAVQFVLATAVYAAATAINECLIR